MKKIVFLFVVIIMSIIFAVSASALSETGQCGDKVYWKYDKSTKELIISGEGAMENYLRNDYSPFENCFFEKIVIEDGVTSIGDYVFYECSIRNIEIPNSVITIGKSALYDCSLSEIIIPDSVTNIGDYAFFGSDLLEDITMSNNITQIGYSAFSGIRYTFFDYNWKNGMLYIDNYLVEVKNDFSGKCEIKEDTKVISDQCFSYCYRITEFEISENNEYYSVDQRGVLFNKDKTQLIQYPRANDFSSYEIPNSVKTIGKYSFYNVKNLTNVIIPNSVKLIGINAFAECGKLDSIEIPYGIVSIPDKAFYDCPVLKNVIIPDSVEMIGELAFWSCDNLENLALGDNIKSIGRYAFYKCNKLKNIIVPFGIEKLEDTVFGYCESLESIVLPKNVKQINRYAFYGNKNLKFVHYEGSKEQWESLSFSWDDINIKGVTMHYNCEYRSEIPTTCLEEGHTKGIWCSLCGWLSGKNNGDKPNGHSYTSKITIQPTHLKVGVETFTCHCGDTYTRDVPKLSEHTYKAVVTNPTCTKQGYTTYTCECSCSYTADYVKANGHSYTSKVTDPTCTQQGYTTYTCACGDTYKADYVKANGHSFTNYISDGKATCVTNGKLIAKCDNCTAMDTKTEKGTHKFSEDFTVDVEPTCTKEGEKSRHCIYCSEVTDRTTVDKTEHNYNISTVEPTCTDRGFKIYICACGHNYSEPIPVKDHSYTLVVTPPTCTEQGYTIYTCECGYSYKGDYKNAKGHSFNGSACSNCSYDKADSCSCNCHKSGISAIIWKIINFFNKLLRKNNTCSCGAAHY